MDWSGVATAVFTGLAVALSFVVFRRSEMRRQLEELRKRVAKLEDEVKECHEKRSTLTRDQFNLLQENRELSKENRGLRDDKRHLYRKIKGHADPRLQPPDDEEIEPT